MGSGQGLHGRVVCRRARAVVDSIAGFVQRNPWCRHERELGVACVDIGAGTTDVAIFTGGAIRHTAVIPIAGDLITSYGTMIFAPLSDARFALGTTFIIDLYFSGIIVAGLVASRCWRATRAPAITTNCTAIMPTRSSCAWKANAP